MNQRLQATIYGRVQGVGFRAYVVQNAQALGLSGTVRNSYFPQRTVEVIAEGPDAALQQLLVKLYQGPALSRVDTIDAHFYPYTGECSGFRFA